MPYYIPFLWLFWSVFVTGFLLGYANEMDTNYRYTYQEPSCDPGKLSSDRLNGYWWTALIVGYARFAYLMVTAARLSSYENGILVLVHLVVGIVYLGFEAANAIVWGRAMQNCNLEDDNPCNDYRICGVFGANFTSCPKNYCPNPNLTSSCAHLPPSPTNSCSFLPVGDVCSIANLTNADVCSLTPTVIPWNPTVTADDLGHNLEYSVSFWLSIGMFALGLFILLMAYFLRESPPPSFSSSVDDGSREIPLSNIGGLQGRRGYGDGEDDSSGNEDGNAKASDRRNSLKGDYGGTMQSPERGVPWTLESYTVNPKKHHVQ
jgi:hypothetical protein